MKNRLLMILALSLLAIIIYVKKTDVDPPIIVHPPIIVEPPKFEEQYQKALDSITKDELKVSLEYLASKELEGRMSGKKGNVLAAEFVEKAYSRYGLPTMYQKFDIRQMNPGPKKEIGDNFTQNVYAWMEGNDPKLKDEIVVIGAHMDHIGYGPSMSRSKRIEIHPGADDNASGTVALMSIAKAFSILKGQNKRTVVFQSYSAEEMGLIGSRYYCNNPVFPKENPNIKKHVFMLNLDMVGYLGKGIYTSSFSSGESSLDISDIISKLGDKYSFAKDITSRGSGGSDHASFYNKGVPIAFLHTGGHRHYHTPEDTADKINYDGVEQVAKYGFELAWQVVQAENPPKFNYGGFKPMPYTHDHGYAEVPFPSSHKE